MSFHLSASHTLDMAFSAQKPVAFALGGPVARDDLPGLCDRVSALVARSDTKVVYCDVAAAPPDAVTVDALARMQLAARRHSCLVRLRNASPDLLALLAFLGLADVLRE